MKKTYLEPNTRIISEVVDTPLLGASIIAGGEAQSGGEGGVIGGNGGDANTKAMAFDW